ncbi:hypothetical protein YYC_05039 [Plasmodium yoelii 17X]|uniref:Uncharacterized protein n=4 Tax=Plasmodium yoelii TaxID=5861 RepID=A0AAF0AYH6_PLAYO|nr:conserved Plasmodium protein, unknown function [Plasmodium yoelii]EAA16646.1 hypothetical protein [Plasmodium yoelii yoelii]ETB57238.1 hypothetical protein YYC_05039 [Plasmodium yoelii 17X]WBY55092.1 hypothetical protein Py17XNL_000303729 [Plasmodium yoelii yoelii]CDU16348.1 conserved Plasmodium protein, unknown function [Plasmodium yoelii]VTZ72653.1 conserved Plasmodium protein, unknown function [Plasmodium yoelii]|eukprot:XP_725081.1 conserved Plasmodium protein, unknown function [Plasmodium yoelii]
MIKYMLKIQNYNSLLFLKKKKKKFYPINFITIKRHNHYSTVNKNEKQKKKINNPINHQDNSWSILPFEKNITFFSVSFYLLLSAVLALHFYNNSQENMKSNIIDQIKEKEKKNLIELENKKKEFTK